MTRVVVDQPLANVLRTSGEPAQVVDADGRILGYFTPEPGSLRTLYDEASAAFDQTDFEAALAEGGGRPLADILRDLRQPS
jgi:hypothetical protein